MRIDFDSLVVVYYGQDGSRRELAGGAEVRMGLGQLLTGMTMEQVWRSKLKGNPSSDLPDPEREARRIGADLVCGKR